MPSRCVDGDGELGPCGIDGSEELLVEEELAV